LAVLVLGGGQALGPLAGCGAESPQDGAGDMAPFQELVRNVIVHEIKEKYKDERNWGHTTQVERVRIKGKWFEPRVEKHPAEVNDGLWQRAEITLVEPDKNLRVQVNPETSSDPDRNAFSLQLAAKISGEAHIERWRKGIKMFNAKVLFDAVVEARIRCDLAIRREPGELIDDVVLDPRVTGVELQLADFDLKQVGILGRDVARQLSDPLKPVISHELHRREPKIVEKANAAIDKRRDRLRFSASKFLSTEWSKLAATLSASTPVKPAPK
jgi:hypothetical protein